MISQKESMMLFRDLLLRAFGVLKRHAIAHEESARGAVMAINTRLENQLEQALSIHTDDVPGGYFARNELALELGIIPQSLFDEINHHRLLRNKGVAHPHKDDLGADARPYSLLDPLNRERCLAMRFHCYEDSEREAADIRGRVQVSFCSCSFLLGLVSMGFTTELLPSFNEEQRVKFRKVQDEIFGDERYVKFDSVKAAEISLARLLLFCSKIGDVKFDFLEEASLIERFEFVGKMHFALREAVVEAANSPAARRWESMQKTAEREAKRRKKNQRKRPKQPR